jgi:hypothetical protein
MAFLDNSGDIILDAVLTDTGRFRLAKGDNSFRIKKFAPFDDEIDYTLYDLNHASGSAYYDIQILQTPILEAFTNNASFAHSKLVSIPRTNILYMPVLKLNELHGSTSRHSNSSFVVCVNKDTEDALGGTTTATTVTGILYGATLANANYIRVDSGLDTDFELSPSRTIPSDLVETQYMVKLDRRFGTPTNPRTNTRYTPAFVDDDQIATYIIPGAPINDTGRSETTQVIRGPRGTRLDVAIAASLDLASSDTLFTNIGFTESDGTYVSGVTTKGLDATLRIEGMTIGSSIDIPLRFVKKS